MKEGMILLFSAECRFGLCG